MAGEHAVATFGSRWRPMIDEALGYWRGEPAAGPFPLAGRRRHEVSRFVQEVVESADSRWKLRRRRGRRVLIGSRPRRRAGRRRFSSGGRRPSPPTGPGRASRIFVGSWHNAPPSPAQYRRSGSSPSDIAAPYSVDRSVPNIAGSSVDSEHATPADSRPGGGCEASDGTVRVTRFESRQTSSTTPWPRARTPAPGRRPRVHRHRGTRLAQGQGDGPADPPARAGDQRDLSVETNQRLMLPGVHKGL
jgi:hypothetical protein